MNKSSDKIVKLRRVQNNSLEIEKLKLEIEKLNKNYSKLNKKIKKINKKIKKVVLLNNSTYVYEDESDGTKLSL
jgi:predicted  nucleic acid-binding Zn-ribbon protein